MACKKKNCVLQAAKKADKTSKKLVPEGQVDGPGDAFRHCMWACLVYTNCGKDAYNAGVIDHEVEGATWAQGPGQFRR